MASDPYLDDEVAVERLWSEYLEHNRLVIAVDFDDTVYDFHKAGNIHENVLTLLRRCQGYRHYIVAFTASKPDRYKNITEYFQNQCIEIDSININPIPLPFGNNGKIYYNILLDDRAGLSSAFYILKKVIDRIDSLENARSQHKHLTELINKLTNQENV